MGGSSKPPEYPKPEEVFAEQARWNRVNTTSPFGGQRWNEGADGRWTQETFLSPEMEGLAQLLMQRAGQAPQQFQMPGLEGLTQQTAGHIGQASPKPIGHNAMPQLGSMLGAMPEGSGVGGLGALLQGGQQQSHLVPRDRRGG